MSSSDPPTALVTGGAKRIGAAVGTALAGAGCRVAVHANTSLDEAEDLADRIGGVAVQADLQDPQAAQSLVSRAAEALGGPVTYLVNNASAFPRTRLQDATYEDLDAMMRLHAWAPLALTRSLAAQGGEAAVNLLDTRITSHDPTHMPYHLSKQALAALTRTLARELAPMRVSGVAPGPVLEPTDGSDGSRHQAAIDATLLGRAGRPEEVASAVRFLLQAEYITGDILYVDGGRHLRR